MMVVSVEESDFCKALVRFISSCIPAKSCWYSLKVVSSDIPSLPEALGLSYESMMYMLQCCGLAGRRKDGDWIFFPQKFCTFRNTHYLQTATDVISSKIAVKDEADNHGNGKKIRKKVYFIRLGVDNLKSITFAGLPAKAPRIHGIVSYRSEFQDTLWLLATQYQKIANQSYTKFERFLIGKEAVERQKPTIAIAGNTNTISGVVLIKNDEPLPGLVLSGGLSDQEEGQQARTHVSIDLEEAIPPCADVASDESQQHGPPTSLLINRIRTHLLPLLIEDNAIAEMDNFWQHNIDEKQIETALLLIVGSIHEEKEKKLSTILETDHLELSPRTLSNTSSFPKLRQYGIPLGNKQVHQSILRDLFSISKKTTTSSTSLSMELNSGEERSLVLIPRPTGFRNMVRNEKEVGWFSELLKAIIGNTNQEAAESRTIQFICYVLARKYKDTFIEAVKQMGTQLIEPLDPIATFALQSVCNLPGSKMKLLKRFLEAEMGARVFSSPREIKKVLGMDSVVPLTGVFHYAGSANVVDPRSREKIPWMYKSVKEIVRLLIRMQVREKRLEFDWNHLDISTCIDHGKGFLRATLICVIRQLDGTGKLSYRLFTSYLFSLHLLLCCVVQVNLL